MRHTVSEKYLSCLQHCVSRIGYSRLENWEKKDGIYADAVLNLFGLCMALDEPGKCEIWQDTGCDGVRYAL